MKKLSVVAATIWLVGAGFAHAADVAAGEKVAKEQCAACHGADGNSTNSQWPKLAGQHAEYTIQQVEMFKSGARHNNLMTPVAKGLSDADLTNVAAFYATQASSTAGTEPEVIEIAEPIYRGGLAAAVDGVLKGLYQPLDFRFFVGKHEYDENILDLSVVLGKYQPVGCRARCRDW